MGYFTKEVASDDIMNFDERILKGYQNIYLCTQKIEKDFEKDFEGYLQNIIPIFVDYEKFSYKNFIRSGAILKKLENKVDLFYPHIILPFMCHTIR